MKHQFSENSEYHSFMNTEGIKIHFEKDENKIMIQQLEKDHYHIITQVAISKEIIEDEFFAEIPALNIHVSTRISKAHLQQNIHDAIASFFNFRLKMQGKEEFLMTMLSLGFSISEKIKNPNATLTAKSKKSELYKQSLELA